MNSVWVLVCDAARGRLYEVRENDPPWRLVDSWRNDASRRKGSELVRDRAGRRTPEGRSVHHNALASASSPKEREETRFAKTLAASLDQSARSHESRDWILVAPPRLLGKLKKTLTAQTAKQLLATLDKDLSEVGPRQLEEYLCDVVRLSPDEREVLRETTKVRH
jgi:protein required for attachment to host cells